MPSSLHVREKKFSTLKSVIREEKFSILKCSETLKSLTRSAGGQLVSSAATQW